MAGCELYFPLVLGLAPSHLQPLNRSCTRRTAAPGLLSLASAPRQWSAARWVLSNSYLRPVLSVWLGLAVVAQAVAPAPPSNCVAAALSATATNATIELSWNDNSTTETKWKIQYSVANGNYSDLFEVASGTTATTGVTGVSVNGAALNTVYHFKILASNGTEYSAASNVATVGTFDLAEPINFSVTAVDPCNVIMSWEEGSTSEAGFAIERKVGTGAWEYLGAMGANALALSPTNLIEPLGSYSFRIRAYKGSPPTTPDSPVGANVSAYSNVSTVTAGAYTLTASKVSGKPVVNLSWPDIQNETGYQIIYKAAADTSYTLLGEVGANVTTYQVLAPNINPTKSYSFIVRPFIGSSSTGIMGMTSEPSVTIDAYTPTATAVPYQTIVNLSWPDLSNETSYQIWYLAPDTSGYAFLTEVAANVTSYQCTVPKIEPAKSYSFVIVPYNGSTQLCESSVANATVDGITSKTGTSSTAGSPFSHTFTHLVAAGTVSSRTLTGIPSTLTFDSGTGALSGVYPAVGNYTLHYTVNFTGGGSLAQTFYIRVRPAQGAPVVGTSIPAWNGVAGASRDTPLADTFSDPEAESAVRVSTTLGDMNFILFDTATPATVANFMSYVNSSKYVDVVFHRSVANFMIQGGAFKGTGTGDQFSTVVTNAPVINEPGIANERGTIAMAKLPGDPNSATDQFFVSLNDNRDNLDNQNGGFTSFGRVAGNGMAVADAISNLPNGTFNLIVDGGSTAVPFPNFPLNDATLPAVMDQTKLVKINSVTTIPTMSYSITGNTNPAVATASIVNGQLHLLGLTGGRTTITVTATDLDNLTTSQDVTVDLTDTYATWAARQTFTGGQSGLSQNPDGDAWNNLQEYAFLGDPAHSNNTNAVVFAGVSGVAPAAQYLTLTLPVRKFSQGLTYFVEANDGLSGAWSGIWKSTDGFAVPSVVSALDQADRTVVTIKDSAVIGGRQKRFLRTRIVQE